MSLTEKAHRERMWGSFPTLRQALEDKKLPDRFYGLTSAHDNIFDQTRRLMQIALLAVEYEKNIKETAQSVGEDKMYTDLRWLKTYLKDASEFFTRKAKEIEAIQDTFRPW